MTGVTGINWSILGNALAADYSGKVHQGFEIGRKLRDERDMRNALADYYRDPQNPNALRYVGSRNPELAGKLEDRARAGRTRNALAAYLGDEGMEGGPSPSPAAVNGGAPVNALLQPPGPAASQPNQSPNPEMAAPREPSPRAPRSAALQELARNDPETFFKVQQMSREERKAAADLLEQQLDIGARVAFSVSRLPPEQQNAAYQQHRAEVEASGVIDLPDEWDPAQAQARIDRGMKVLDVLKDDRDERKFAYDREEDARDNARDERRISVTEQNNIRSNTTSRDNSIRSTETAMENRRNTPAAVTTNERGETVIVYPDNRVTTARGSRDTRGRGRGGRGGGAGVGPDLIGPIQSDGKRRIQYSKSAGAYIDLATGKPVN